MNKLAPELVREKIDSVDSLPTIPSVVKKMCAIVESPNTSAQDLGNLISRDQVLSAKVLKLVNSPFYGFSGRISTITHAIVLLGFNVVKGIVLSASVFDIMEQTFKGLWKHSLGTSVVAQYLAKRYGIAEPEEVSVAGLLHDLGKVAINTVFPKYFESILDYQQKNNSYLFESERNVLGVDHAIIGSWLAKHWNLPLSLQEPIKYHHFPHRSQFTKKRTSIVFLSDMLVKALGFGTSGDNNLVQSIPPFVLKVLDIKNFEQELGEILPDIKEILDEAMDFSLV